VSDLHREHYWKILEKFAFPVREFLNFREIPIPNPKLVAYSHNCSERCGIAYD
jgi:hypothetical protein